MSEPSLPEESIFMRALEIKAAAERAAFLERACGANRHLRAEMEALLRANDKSGDLLDLPEKAAAAAATCGDPEAPGTVIGPYKLLEQIGEGGMGVVFLAEQQPMHRKVALKLIRTGMASRRVLARFEAERQALALMDHPNIAKVHDVGLTPGEPGGVSAGRPYIVMEYFQGVPLTEYCDAARLSIKERLELFLPVCLAVQHAHQKGIIHRDLKPSNILIALYDGKPVPKLIDFGLAKATQEPLTEQSLSTAHGLVLGTPLYMSPEQAELNNLDIDTRTDIYALGVILYELLTGTTPLERERLKQTPWNEVLRLIREEEPPTPSTKLATRLPAVAAQRRLEPAKLARLVRGDLDWIVMKALDKDRSRRYETANGLAEDIQRYLADEPVLAGPPTAAYRLRKFARRHRGALLVTVALMLMFAALVGSIGWMIRDREAREAEITRQVEAREEEISSKVNDAMATARALLAENQPAPGPFRNWPRPEA